jgi:hypothetical protein
VNWLGEIAFSPSLSASLRNGIPGSVNNRWGNGLKSYKGKRICEESILQDDNKQWKHNELWMAIMKSSIAYILFQKLLGFRKNFLVN